MKHLGRWVRAVAVMGSFLVIPACSKNNQSSNPPSFDPQNTVATEGPSSGEIVLTWTPATDFSGTGITYFVYPSLTMGGENVGGGTSFSTTNPTGMTLTGLTPGDPYFFIVQAVDGNGDSDGNLFEVGDPSGVIAHP